MKVKVQKKMAPKKKKSVSKKKPVKKELTEKEKLQRDIIAISYLLIDKHTSGMKLDQFSLGNIGLND